MPELPEVETIRIVMEQYIPGHMIESVHLRRPKMLRGQSQRMFREGLLQRKILGADRRGKFLLLRMDRGSLLVHLGMTGQVFYSVRRQTRPEDLPRLPDKHTHLTLKLDKDAKLYFRDVRMFGRFALLNANDEKALFARLGPEPLGPNFTAKFLFHSIQKRSASIKAVLLNQTVVAGLGNIYADESLFRAGILPQTPARRITWDQSKRLHRAIRRVLKEAVHRGGSSISDFLDPRHRKGTFQLILAVYGREGKPCLNCGAFITKDVVAQRGTHFCPRCQR